MVSVVLASYNGETYIEEQLQSIYEQSRKPDEVLIRDDGSTDNTVQICRNFIELHNLKHWNISVNRPTLGYVDNFLSGIRKAKGDIIFLCDQDDIWLPERIAVMEGIMQNNTSILSLTSTFSRINANGKLLQRHVKHPYRIPGKPRKISAEEFLKFHTYLGMSMAIRKSLSNLVSTANENYISHDILLNLYAADAEGLYHLDQVLTIRRSYSDSTSNRRIQLELDSSFNGNKRLQTLSRKIILFDEGQYHLKNLNFEKKMRLYRRFYKKRYDYIKNRRFTDWIKNIKNISCYTGFKEYFSDLYFMLKRSL